MAKQTGKTIDRTEIFGGREGKDGIIRCDACPVLCRIRPGRAGACARYANEDSRLIRTDPLVLTERNAQDGGAMVPFLDAEADWDGNPVTGAELFVTGIGAGTTYPDYKPAPFIVSQKAAGVDSLQDGLRYNKDGSIDLYFAPKAPPGYQNNWVQTVPGKSWFTILRMYSPLEAWIDQSWRPSEVIRTN